MDSRMLSAEQPAAFGHYGFLVVRRFVDEQTLSELTDETDALVARKPAPQMDTANAGERPKLMRCSNSNLSESRSNKQNSCHRLRCLRNRRRGRTVTVAVSASGPWFASIVSRTLSRSMPSLAKAARSFSQGPLKIRARSVSIATGVSPKPRNKLPTGSSVEQRARSKCSVPMELWPRRRAWSCAPTTTKRASDENVRTGLSQSMMFAMNRPL
jgi:hypothetical protein